jgi:hypothetical protein
MMVLNYIYKVIKYIYSSLIGNKQSHSNLIQHKITPYHRLLNNDPSKYYSIYSIGELRESVNLLIKNKTISKLGIHTNDGDTIDYINKILKKNNTISELSLSKSSISGIGIETIINNINEFSLSNIRQLDISYNKLRSIDIHYIFKALDDNNQITNLNMSGISLSRSRLKLLCSYIIKSQRIRQLYIKLCDIQYNDVDILYDLLVRNKSIRKLDISYNRIGDDGLNLIYRGLLINNTLRYLCIDYISITDKSISVMSNIIKANKLRGLYFSNSSVWTYTEEICIALHYNKLLTNDTYNIRIIHSRNRILIQLNRILLIILKCKDKHYGICRLVIHLILDKLFDILNNELL